MGNTQTVKAHMDFSDLENNYTYDSKHNDSRFGELKMLRKKQTNERVFQKDFSTNDPVEFGNYISRIKSRLHILHPNVLQILGYNSKKEDLFCADYYKVSLFFEGFETDLETEISKRQAAQNFFSEAELRCLLDSVISGCAFLEKNETAHGDIRPFNILITRNRDYKVLETSLFQSAYNPSYFSLLSGLEASSHFPSPQVFRQFGAAKPEKATDFSRAKNDVFGLGVTMLTAARLRTPSDLYDYNRKGMKQAVVAENLTELRGRYSEELIEAISVLLNFDEAQRPSFVELDEELKGIRADIRARALMERTMEAQRKSQANTPVKAQASSTPTQTPEASYNNVILDDELDRRVRTAVQKSEKLVNKSPSKFRNKVIDDCIHTYLRKDPLPNDAPLLYKLSPHLTVNSSLAPILNVYSVDRPGLTVSQIHVADVSQHMYASMYGRVQKTENYGDFMFQSNQVGAPLHYSSPPFFNNAGQDPNVAKWQG